ncbi:MAG: uroporphyrinogen-III synthase, partial [Pseudomonadota bacterium]|nr:uroporphyrinogen-III synthase [Pseudomonadota bacterium]
MLLFTRPLPKLKASASAFEKAGIDAVGVATSNIIDISSERKAAAEFLASNAVNAIVVTSVYAVDTVIEGLRETANELPLIIAVGDATARKLQAGLQAFSSTQVAIPEAHTSEGILA